MALSQSELEAFQKLSQAEQDAEIARRVQAANATAEEAKQTADRIAALQAEQRAAAIAAREPAPAPVTVTGYVDADVELGSTGRTSDQIGSGLSQVGSGSVLAGTRNIFGGLSDYVEDGVDAVSDFFSPVTEPPVPDDLENYTLDDDGNIIPLADDAAVDPLSGFGSIGADNNFLTGLTAAGEITEDPPDTDWRVRLSLGKDNRNLYKDPDGPGILYPLVKTNGIIFPYTPTIAVQHVANYETYDLTHSNYRGYFYRGSSVQNILINATFTAQDTAEANYMLAALHFLRSATKMFYGQDAERGMPPPLVFLSGFGEFQFKNHPCAVTLMNFNLPNDVDYIAAGVPDQTDPTTGFTDTLPAYTGHLSHSASISRRIGAGVNRGAESGTPRQSQAAQMNQNTVDDLATLTKIYGDGKTYVPTKIDINFTMVPIQTRTQVSKQFSLKDYASGTLIKKGFW